MEFKFTGGRGTASSSHTSGGIFKHPWWLLLCGKLQTWDDSSGWEVFASGHCVRSWIRPTLHPRRLRSQQGSLGHMDLLLQGEPVDQASGISFTKVKVLTSISPLLDIVGPRELDWQRSVFFPANCIVGSKPTLRSLLFVSMWEKIHAHCYILEKLFSFVSSFLLIAFSSTAWAHLPFISQPVPHFRISNSKETTHSSSLGAFLIFCLFVPFFTKYQKVWTNFLCKSFQFSKYIDWQEEKIYLLKLFSTPGWVPQTWTWPRKLF